MPRAGRDDYVVDDEALAHMARLSLAGPLVARLAAHPTNRFNSEAVRRAHLQGLGLDQLKILPDPVKVATEAALWAAVGEQGLLGETVIVSDAPASSAWPTMPSAGSIASASFASFSRPTPNTARRWSWRAPPSPARPPAVAP
jgi:hypothetical protein